MNLKHTRAMSSREKRRSRGTINAGLRRPILPHLRLHAWFPFHEQTFFFTHPENVIYARSLLLSTPQGRLRPSIALKTTRTSYQLFFGDNPRPRAGSLASHMARMKMEGHAGRFPSLSPTRLKPLGCKKYETLDKKNETLNLVHTPGRNAILARLLSAQRTVPLTVRSRELLELVLPQREMAE